MELNDREKTAVILFKKLVNITDIAESLGVSRNVAHKYINRNFTNGQIDKIKVRRSEKTKKAWNERHNTSRREKRAMIKMHYNEKRNS